MPLTVVAVTLVAVAVAVSVTVRRERLTAGSFETAAHKKPRNASSHSYWSTRPADNDDGDHFDDNEDMSRARLAAAAGGRGEVRVTTSPDNAARRTVSQRFFVGQDADG